MTFFFIVLGLQLLDIASTIYGKKLGAVEANPLLKKLSTDEVIALKILFMGLVFFLQSKINTWAWGVIIGLYVLVLVNNLKVIYERRTRP